MNNIEIILSMYKNGIGVSKISSIFKVTELDINNILYNNGIETTDYIYADRDASIYKLYNENNGIVQIANALNINRHTVTNVLKKQGIYRGNKHASNDSPEKSDRNNKIISLYNSGLSLSQVAKKVNMSAGGIYKILNDKNITIRPQRSKGHSSGITRNRKHNFDLNFFETIDTEEKAYWLGFMYADGYVNYNGLVSINLQEKDKDHLYKFKETLKAYSTELKYNSRSKSYNISLRSVKMSSDLIKLGCKQKKSLTLLFPKESQVPKDLLHHFMRGYFDGDGCICVTEKTNTFSLLGTFDFIDKYYDEVLLNTGDTKHSLYKKNNVYELAISKPKSIDKIYEYLYKDASVFLERKKEKFLQNHRRLKTKLQKS